MGRMLELFRQKKLSISNNTPPPEGSDIVPFSCLLDNELFLIITSDSRHDINNGLPKRKDIINAFARQKTEANPVSTQKITQSILAAITDTPGYYILIAAGLTVMCALTLSVVTLAVISAVLTLATIASACYKIYVNYIGLGYKKTIKTRNLELLALRLEALKELNSRIKPHHSNVPATLIDRAGQAEEDAEEDKVNQSLLRMLVHDTAAMVITTLSLTFLASVPPILLAVGLTAATAAFCSPIGLIVAGAIILLTTTFFAYKQYCLIKNEQNVEKYQRKLENEIENEHRLYEHYRSDPNNNRVPENIKNTQLALIRGDKPLVPFGVNNQFSIFTRATRRPTETDQNADLNPSDLDEEYKAPLSKIFSIKLK